MTAGREQEAFRFGLFRLGGHLIAFDVAKMAEICRIRSLDALLTPVPAVIGAVDVRGGAVPVVDTASACGLSGLETAHAVAVVTVHEDRRIAFSVDAVAGICEVPQGGVQAFPSATREDVFLGGTFRSGGELVNVIDPIPAFGRGDIPSAPVARSHPATAHADPTTPHLVFEAGRATFAVEATAVFSTVPRQTIEPGSLRSGLCLGAISHLGRRIPVVDLNRLTGLGRGALREIAETVVLRFPGGRTLGLAVDQIRRIRAISSTAEAEPPGALVRTMPFVRATAADKDTQIFLLDAERLTGDDRLQALAGLSDETRAQGKTGAGTETVEGTDVVPERRRYLVVESAGVDGAVPVNQVVRVIRRPERLVPVRDEANVLGYFEHDGSIVPLVGMAGLLGREVAPEADGARVLIHGSGPDRIGVLVDRVKSIDTSAWSRTPPKRTGAPGKLVGFGHAETARVLGCIDLDAILHRIEAGPPLIE